MGRQLSGKAGQTRGFYFFQPLFSQVNTSSLPCYDMESAGWLNLSCVVSRDVQTHSFMTKTLKCRVFCDYQQVTQCFAQIKHLAACSRVKLGKAVKEGSKLIKLYRAQPPLVQMKSPSTSSHYCSSNTPAASSLPLLLVGSLWRGPADHAESANVHGCVWERLWRGGSEGFMLWVMRSCIISPVGVCAPSPSLPWHALWKTEEWSSTQDLQCVSVWLFSVWGHIMAEHECE